MMMTNEELVRVYRQAWDEAIAAAQERDEAVKGSLMSRNIGHAAGLLAVATEAARRERERIALMFDEDVEKARSDADGLRSRGVEPVAQGYRARDALKVAARIRAMGDHVGAAKGGA